MHVLDEATDFQLERNNLHIRTDGSILDLDTKAEVPVYKMKDGSRFFLTRCPELHMTFKHDYGMLILAVMGKTRLDSVYWERAVCHHIDGNKENYHHSNLCCSHQIEIEELSGFYYIPGFENYGISEIGEAVHIETATKVLPSMNTSSDMYYPYFNFTHERRELPYVHVLLAIVFKEPPHNYPLLQVDHVDCNKKNFDLDNLEWVTAGENNLRAYRNGQKSDNYPVLVKNLSTGTVVEHFSIGEAARVMGVHRTAIDYKLGCKYRVMKKQWVVKLPGDDTPWEVYETKVVEAAPAVQCFDITTKEVTEYPSAYTAEKALGLVRGSIKDYLRMKRKGICGGYLVKLASDASPWEEPTEYAIEIFKRGLHAGTRVYRLFDPETNKTETYYGTEEIEKLTGANTRTIYLCARDNKIMHGRYVLELLN